MLQEGLLGHAARNTEKAAIRLKYSTLIFIAVVLMLVVLIYVWSHIQMTELEYQVAAEMKDREQLLEEQKKLKLEYATLRSPQRVEAIAKDKLHMSYPVREQIVLLK